MTGQASSARPKRIFIGAICFLVAFGLWYAFRPEKLFINKKIDEPVPASISLPTDAELLDAQTLLEVQALYRRLIDAEDAKDFDTVREIVWRSRSALFVAKTATAAEGNWAGFWGHEVVVQHIRDISEGPFRIDPDYARVKTVGLTHDVAETYAPASITVAYAGQTAIPKPFLMIVEWVRTPDGWKMATDIALPIPPPPTQNQ